ncbi:MAG TPA: SH3 domain-containing protein [Methylocystis sp.]|nr:SH3 domain-containing protein [Methylocystis sp.]
MKNMFCAATAGLFAFLVTGAALAETWQSPAVLRSGPGTKWRAISAIPAGADVEVLNCGEGWRHSWCQVRYGSLTGWVNAPALGTAGPNVVVAPVVTTDAANLRERASLLSSVVEVIPGGETIDVLRCKNGIGNGWCYVSYKGKAGFVRGGLLARQGSVIPQ